jgi:hypothetical protein
MAGAGAVMPESMADPGPARWPSSDVDLAIDYGQFG